MPQTPIDFYKPMREAVYDLLAGDAVLQALLGDPATQEWYHERRYAAVKSWPSISFRIISDGIDMSGTTHCKYRPRVEIIAYSEDVDTLRQIIQQVRATLTWPSEYGTRLDITGFRVDSLRCESVFNDPIPAKLTDDAEVFALPTDWQCSLAQTG